MTGRQRALALLCILASVALLYPGISKPVLTLSGELEKAALADFGIDLIVGESDNPQTRDMLEMMTRFLGLDQIEGRVEAYRNTRSILGMAAELRAQGNQLVAGLILSFSVVIPVLKLLLQLAAVVLSGSTGRRLLGVNAALGKWSMADVFVMAMLVAFLAGRASEKVGDLLVMQAELEVGFWYFLAYCIFAIAAGVLVQRPAVSKESDRAPLKGQASETL
ncbi:MAG: paraquat-inducible protein A [Pseudomonadota bacterium]